MRIYELVFIVKPDIPEEEVDAAVTLVEETIAKGGGTVDKVDRWGKKSLAYRVQKHTDGYYVLVQYSMDDARELPKEIERRLRVADSVIKFMTIRIDEDLKRVAKMEAKREKRTSRKPAQERPSRPSPAAPAAPGVPAEAEKGDEEEE